VRHADERPRDGENREAGLQSQHVEHVAARGLQHDRALERADDERILLRADLQVLEDGRSRDGEGASRQVVDDRSEHQQTNHPPAEAFDAASRHVGLAHAPATLHRPRGSRVRGVIPRDVVGVRGRRIDGARPAARRGWSGS
jgi:hypothetical protein